MNLDGVSSPAEGQGLNDGFSKSEKTVSNVRRVDKYDPDTKTNSVRSRSA